MGVQTTKTESVVKTSLWAGPIFGTNTAATSFAAIAATLTQPSSNSTTGAGILGIGGAVAKLMFFGTDADAETFGVKLIAWSKVVSGGVGEFIPTPLAHLTLTLGTGTGVAGGVIGGTSQLMVDTITSNYATAAINIISPADQLPAMVEVSHTGAQYLGVYFDMTGAASANALYMFT